MRTMITRVKKCPRCGQVNPHWMQFCQECYTSLINTAFSYEETEIAQEKSSDDSKNLSIDVQESAQRTLNLKTKVSDEITSYAANRNPYRKSIVDIKTDFQIQEVRGKYPDKIEYLSDGTDIPREAGLLDIIFGHPGQEEFTISKHGVPTTYLRTPQRVKVTPGAFYPIEKIIWHGSATVQVKATCKKCKGKFEYSFEIIGDSTLSGNRSYINLYKPILAGNFPSELSSYAQKVIPRPAKCPQCGHLNTWISWKRIFFSWGKLILASTIALIIGPGIWSSLAYFQYGYSNPNIAPIIPLLLWPLLTAWCIYWFYSFWYSRFDDTVPSIRIRTDFGKNDWIMTIVLFIVGNFILSLLLALAGIIVGWFNKNTGQNVLWGLTIFPSWITLILVSFYILDRNE
jgi:hypothetical protein